MPTASQGSGVCEDLEIYVQLENIWLTTILAKKWRQGGSLALASSLPHLSGYLLILISLPDHDTNQ